MTIYELDRLDTGEHLSVREVRDAAGLDDLPDYAYADLPDETPGWVPTPTAPRRVLELEAEWQAWCDMAWAAWRHEVTQLVHAELAGWPERVQEVLCD